MDARKLDAIERRIGRKIAEVRAERGLTQEELAGLAGLSLQQVRRIELASNTRLTVRRMVELATVLDVEPGKLLEMPASVRRQKPGRPRNKT